MIKGLREFADQYGMIGHKHKNIGLEFGDACQRTFSYFIYLHLSRPPGVDLLIEARRIEKIVDKISLRVPDEADIHSNERLQFRRHWNDNYWFGEAWTMSRDQFIPFWICCVLYSEQSSKLALVVETIELLMKDRKGWCWNYFPIWSTKFDEPKVPDWINPIFRGAMKRRAMAEAFWLELEFFDLEIVFNAAVITVRSWFRAENTGDDLNWQLHFMFSQVRKPTIMSWIAKQVYRLRARPFRFEKDFTALAVQKSYFNNKNAPPMPTLAEPALKLFFQ